MSISLLYHSLIDDAALFPPGNAAMADAVPAHDQHRSAWYAGMVGPFLCPASRLEELAGRLGDRDTPLGVTVVVDTGTGGIEPAVDAVLAEPRLTLRGVEVPLRGEPLAESARRTSIALDMAVGGLDDDGEAAYIEIPRLPGWREALDTVSIAGHRAKLRTGGATAEAYPTEDEVAAFILACLELDVPFKCTAGLHHAVRHTADDGSEQHGFLNILLAVADALDGADADGIARTLADRDARAVAARTLALPLGRAAQVRTWFGSYGSCSVTEPLEDLLALGLITKE